LRRSFAVAGGVAVAALLGLQHGCASAPEPAPPIAEPAVPAEPPPDVPAAEPPAGPVSPVAVPAPRAPEPAPSRSVAPQRLPTLPATVRVGLETDLDAVTLPCCDGEVVAEAGGERIALVSPVTVRPAARAVSPTVWRLQAAALRDDGPARELARRLRDLTRERTQVQFDARAGLYRVRVGGWASREEAETAARRLRTQGLESSWVVSEGGGVTDPALDLTQGGRVRRIPGRRFVVRAPTGGGLRVEGHRYRGAIEVFLNDRGRLNLVNELPLEEYLRGVVPRELGPGQYPEIEALKAQAVAARSYTVRNLGGFAEEGYDLCARPQCQVYGGMDDEHPLSDRAVAETAGEVVLWRGEVADTLYTATCGGHTENVETVFPLRQAPYLRGVPCYEAGGTRLAGSAPGRDRFEALLLPAVPGVARAGEGAAGLGEAVAAIVRAAGIDPPVDRLRSLARGEVQRFLASQLDLAADVRLFVRDSDLDYLVAEPPPEWTLEDRRLAAWLVTSGIFDAGAGTAALGSREARELVLRIALYLRVLERREGTFAAYSGQLLSVREGGELRGYAAGQGLATLRAAGADATAGPLLLVPGDAVDLFLRGDRLIGVVQRIDPGGAAFDRGHERSSWSRFRSDAELARLVRARYPGFDLRSFEILSRGVSGRVGRLRMRGTSGETIELEGLAIRWTFDLPDTLFQARHLAPRDGPAGWRFDGRGWGHGVGMCQTGAFGMARRGYGYLDILGHYYTDVRVERLATAPRR